MIGKLIVYDLKKMKRIYIFCVVALLSAILSRIINIKSDIQIIGIIGSTFSSLTYSAIVAVLANMFIYLLANFHNTFYKDESYLIHTLPVSKNALLWAKYVMGLILMAISVLVCLVSLFIQLYSKSFMALIKTVLLKTFDGYSIPAGLMILLVVGVILAQICFMLSLGYFSIVKGNQSNKNRGVVGIIWYAVVYFGCMITTLVLAVICFAISGNVGALFAQTLSHQSFLIVMILAFVLYLAYAVGLFFLTRKEFNKGVNVD